VLVNVTDFWTAYLFQSNKEEEGGPESQRMEGASPTYSIK
jgi:hypothetical protein